MSEKTDYTPAQIMAAISAALKAGDMPAAAGLVRLLAVKDPTSAQMILDGLELVALVEDAPAEPTHLTTQHAEQQEERP